PVKAVALRAHVLLWEREIPKGQGITGLWRPVPPENSQSAALPFLAAGDSVYSFRQEGSSLTGTVEGVGTSFTGGSDIPAAIMNGKIDGSAINFKAGNS